jgi:hypothetical protein
MALAAMSVASTLSVAPGADAAVYWTSRSPFGGFVEDSIGRANLDGSVVNQTFIFGARGPCGVAVDEGFIYWANANPAGDTIGAASLDGSAVDEGFIRGGAGPCGVAVDEHFIYWANMFGGDSISRASIIGEGAPTEPWISGASGPSAVAVNKQFVYWTNSGQNTGNVEDANTIGRAKLDGTEANQKFITGASTPRGIAVDGAHIYWANTGNGTIGRATVEGNEVEPEFIKGASEPCGVAVNGAHIYWANRANGTIGRANLDGTGAEQSFISGATQPCGVAVDSVVVPPAPTITSPASGATYAQGQVVAARYACGLPAGASLTACSGPVANGAAIDTAALGSHEFTVTATDSFGVSEFETVEYTVVANRAAVVPTPAHAPSPNDSFTSGTLTVEHNGTIVISERSSDPGTFTGVATTSRGYLARVSTYASSVGRRDGSCKRTKHKKCKRRPRKPGPALYGSGTAASTGAGAVQLTIRPNAPARAALLTGKTLHLRILVTFQSSRGGAPTTAVTTATAKGVKPKRKHR